MDNNQNKGNCLYNLIYTQYNEDLGMEEFFSYDLAYPVLFNLKNDSFYINPTILNNINSTILLDVNTFKDNMNKEQKQFNNNSINNSLPTKNFKARTTYNVTFNKNHILSTIMRLTGFTGELYPEYDDLYNYNYDLLTGNTISLKDVLKSDVNVIEVVSNYINYKIQQHPSMYHSNIKVEIPEAQSFYLTDDGIIIYFGLDEIAPRELGIPKFKMMFSKFAPYINTRFYCEAQNIGARRKSINNRFMRY